LCDGRIDCADISGDQFFDNNLSVRRAVLQLMAGKGAPTSAGPANAREELRASALKLATAGLFTVLAGKFAKPIGRD
jgi:hypothetical protein